METRLSRYIWTHTKKQQLWILLVIALSMIPYFLSFDVPKRIVNGPIQGGGFESADATQLFGRIAMDLPVLGETVLLPGMDLDRLNTLYALSLSFLMLVIINGLFKLYINTYKGRLGERLLRRIRFELVDRVLRFPPRMFKQVKPAEIASMVKDEVEPIGGFTGDAFVQPALLGGQALTALAFIFTQNMWLGFITAFMVTIQAVLIPKMRKRLLVLGRERQLTARQLSGRVSEIVEGIHAIHAFDTSNYERADVASRLGRIFRIRYDLYQWKFLVKFINNFLASVTPFLFYIVGGYLALNGQLDIGQLVAVIAAYKDLPGPLKELIDWDQTRQDVQVKYTQVVDQFTVDNMIDSSIQTVSDKVPEGIVSYPLAAVNLTVADDSGAKLIERINLQVQKGEKIAILGNAADGGEAFAEALGRIVWPESGRITVGESDILELPEAVTGRSISYVASDPYFFSGALRENLLYGLKHAPVRPAEYDERQLKDRNWHVEEAKLSGNPDHDVASDWIDYQSASATGPDDLAGPIGAVLETVQLSTDILDLALRSKVDPEHHKQLAEGLIGMRGALREALEKEGLANLVVAFEPDSYNAEATVGENLLFGNAVGAVFADGAIGNNPYFRKVIASHQLHLSLFKMGYEIAENAIELFSDLPPDHPFFQQLTFMTSDDIPVYQALLNKLKGKSFEDATADEQSRIIKLSFAYVEPRHRFGLLTDDLMQTIVAARQDFHANMPEDMRDSFERYDPDRYIASASIMDNVLFGRLSNRFADGAEQIKMIVMQILRPLGLYDEVFSIGLDFDIGTSGKRLTIAQRQKLNLARVLLRRSDYYVFNRPLASLDQRTQEQIGRSVLKKLESDGENPTVIWVLAQSGLASEFDRIILFNRGAIAEDGSYESLLEKDVFNKMVSG
ncbi:ABC transporter transmembrane domain-containing protein [Hoeflea sp.]|uniref:ABC transporter transmembrane domain-containing protein n=1 Tax=Hoeflea sp. TaxID=1940281 RepID=UPI0037478248